MYDRHRKLNERRKILSQVQDGVRVDTPDSLSLTASRTVDVSMRKNIVAFVYIFRYFFRILTWKAT